MRTVLLIHAGWWDSMDRGTLLAYAESRRQAGVLLRDAFALDAAAGLEVRAGRADHPL
jgi:hypothetical protein